MVVAGDGLPGGVASPLTFGLGRGRAQEQGAFGDATRAREPEGTETEGLHLAPEDGVGRRL